VLSLHNLQELIMGLRSSGGFQLIRSADPWKKCPRKPGPWVWTCLILLNVAGGAAQAQQVQDKCTSVRAFGPPSQLAGEQNFQNLMECLKELRSAVDVMTSGEVAGLRDELKNARSEIADLKREFNTRRIRVVIDVIGKDGSLVPVDQRTNITRMFSGGGTYPVLGSEKYDFCSISGFRTAAAADGQCYLVQNADGRWAVTANAAYCSVSCTRLIPDIK
jgi:hypothetical protein